MSQTIASHLAIYKPYHAESRPLIYSTAAFVQSNLQCCIDIRPLEFVLLSGILQSCIAMIIQFCSDSYHFLTRNVIYRIELHSYLL